MMWLCTYIPYHRCPNRPAQRKVASGSVHVDNTDIGCLDHFIVWIELGKSAKYSKKKCIIRGRHLDSNKAIEEKRVAKGGIRTHCLLHSTVSVYIPLSYQGMVVEYIHVHVYTHH